MDTSCNMIHYPGRHFVLEIGADKRAEVRKTSFKFTVCGFRQCYDGIV